MPKCNKFIRLALGRFHSFHLPIRSLVRMPSSIFCIMDFALAITNWFTHPVTIGFNWLIFSLVDLPLLRLIIALHFSLMRLIDFSAIRIFHFPLLGKMKNLITYLL